MEWIAADILSYHKSSEAGSHGRISSRGMKVNLSLVLLRAVCRRLPWLAYDVIAKRMDWGAHKQETYPRVLETAKSTYNNFTLFLTHSYGQNGISHVCYCTEDSVLSAGFPSFSSGFFEDRWDLTR